MSRYFFCSEILYEFCSSTVIRNSQVVNANTIFYFIFLVVIFLMFYCRCINSTSVTTIINAIIDFHCNNKRLTAGCFSVDLLIRHS